MNTSSGVRRVLVVDDERSARMRLLSLLQDRPGFEVAGEAADGAAACREISRLAPDVVFLDVEMPELGGFDVVEAIGVERMPATVFVTAYDRHALAAFDANAVDYLLKPFDDERFAFTLRKLGAGREAAEPSQPQRLRRALDQARPERLWVRHGEGREPVRVADIQRVSSEGNYVRLHVAGGATYLMRETLGGLLDRLDPSTFRRIHRSHAVHIDHVRKLLPWFGGDQLVMMSDGSRLTMSRTYRDALG